MSSGHDRRNEVVIALGSAAQPFMSVPKILGKSQFSIPSHHSVKYVCLCGACVCRSGLACAGPLPDRDEG